jgi:hypothetical protein
MLIDHKAALYLFVMNTKNTKHAKRTKKTRLEDLLSGNHPNLSLGIRFDGTVEIAGSKGTPLRGFIMSGMREKFKAVFVLNLRRIADEVVEKIPKSAGDSVKDAGFFSKKAGSFSGVKQRTVQLWTEKGLIIPGIADTTGTGERRRYSVLNCIEIGIIKALADLRISFKIIKQVMDWLGEKA